SVTYRAQCLHCHGMPGDGRGPSSPWVNPHPRDFRQGVFKFSSSKQEFGVRKPRRDDLLRILHNGIDGASMPAFNLLAADQVEELASYIIHLSLRGQAEYAVMRELLLLRSRAKQQPELEDDFRDFDIDGALKRQFALIAVLQWRDAQLPSNLIEAKSPYP